MVPLGRAGQYAAVFNDLAISSIAGSHASLLKSLRAGICKQAVSPFPAPANGTCCGRVCMEYYPQDLCIASPFPEVDENFTAAVFHLQRSASISFLAYGAAVLNCPPTQNMTYNRKILYGNHGVNSVKAYLAAERTVSNGAESVWFYPSDKLWTRKRGRAPQGVPKPRKSVGFPWFFF